MHALRVAGVRRSKHIVGTASITVVPDDGTRAALRSNTAEDLADSVHVQVTETLKGALHAVTGTSSATHFCASNYFHEI